MATHQIATRNYLAGRWSIGSGGSDCPTKSELDQYSKIVVNGTYAANQLVKEDDIAAAPKREVTFSLHNDSDLSYSGSVTINMGTETLVSINIGAAGTVTSKTVSVPDTPSNVTASWSAQDGAKYRVRFYNGYYVEVPYGETVDLTSGMWGLHTIYFEKKK